MSRNNWNNENNKIMYHCEKCDHYSSHKHNFLSHCRTRRHLLFQNGITLEMSKITPDHIEHKCSSCGKEFMTQSGLWKHAKKCPKTNSQNQIVDILLKQNQEYKEMLMSKTCEMQQQNKDHMDILLKKDEDLKTLILEICKTTSHGNAITNNTNNSINNNSHNTNNIHSNNKTFNLQFFLNETCKNALNLSEFIQSVKSSVEDIETVGTLGYVDGTSNMILKHLNDLGVERRPIHCTDQKRQTLYIKENNEWLKEDDNMGHMHLLVDAVQKTNLRQLPLWQKLHPSCLKSNSIHTDTYNTMSQELMGGFCHKVKLHVKDSKIINKIVKNVSVDKTLYSI